jgi:hypothetical protein
MSGPQPPPAGSAVAVPAAFTLVGRALDWIRIIAKLNRVPPADENHDSPPFHDMHMLVLALDHLDECLRWLETAQPGPGRAERDAFRAVWAPNTGLRDALEHEEEYLAGYGKRAELDGQPIDAKTVGTWSMSFAFTDAGYLGATVLGIQYDLRPAIERALSLAPLLHEWLGQLHATGQPAEQQP